MIANTRGLFHSGFMGMEKLKCLRCYEMQTLNIDGYVIKVDDEDYDRIIKHKWHILKSKSDCYYAIGRPLTYKKKTLMHHFILGIDRKSLGKKEIDHINGDGLDNRKSNLRIITHQENLLNRKRAQSNSLLGVRGVRELPSGRFQAYCCVSRKFGTVGTYDTLEEAIRERNKFIDKHRLKVKKSEER